MSIKTKPIEFVKLENGRFVRYERGLNKPKRGTTGKGAAIVRHAMAYLEDRYGDGPMTLPKTAAEHGA